MKSNQEILDEFGKKVIKEVFDSVYSNMESFRNIENPPVIFKEFSDFLKSLSEEQYRLMGKYLSDRIGSTLFDFLRIFEESENFKLYYEKDGQRINLAEISESLKAEPIIDNGWIEKFSEELKK